MNKSYVILRHSDGYFIICFLPLDQMRIMNLRPSFHHFDVDFSILVHLKVIAAPFLNFERLKVSMLRFPRRLAL